MRGRILIVKAGSTHPSVRARFGDYERWFIQAMGGDPARFSIVSPFEGDALPDPAAAAGIVLTGSPASVRDEESWMLELAAWVRRADALDVPILGVCFGHQLLGEALGGRVEPMLDGAEFGTVEIRLTDAGRADPLFAGLPARFRVQTVHRDGLVRPPEGAVLLAENDRCPWQAFALGRHRGVQFHLETAAPVLEALAEALGLSAFIEETDAGPRILRNWERHFVRRS